MAFTALSSRRTRTASVCSLSLHQTAAHKTLRSRLFSLQPCRSVIGTIQPFTVSAAGGTAVTIRGSGFVNGATVSLSGKPATVTFRDANTLSVATPALTPGPQQITVTNPDGET